LIPPLPIDSLRPAFEAALAAGPVVVTSPTGSGKSTQVPRWCPGRVLVVEPRRVACRGLASRVAELEGVELGTAVGYHVRDDRRAGERTRIVFATPGIVLRLFEDLRRFDTVILDEFHERTLDVDLLLPLLARRHPGGLVVMSATLEGERVARHLSGRHLHAEGRIWPVEVRHLPGKNLLPEARGLEERVVRAVGEGLAHPGDLLVFLPGKGEIAACAEALSGRRDLDILPLHGGLSLAEQGRAFQPSKRRKVILATNVAETSVTVPGVGVVLDSGLVRRTRYHRGRGFLTLAPIAADSAEQRAGRAGRTAPGLCLRLWSEAARLEPRTPPEIDRESLVPLVLAAATWGERAEDLPFLDPPKEHALEAAREDLTRLGALAGDGVLTERGKELFGLPLDAPLGRLLIAAREGQARSSQEGGGPGLLTDMIDLVAALASGRPLLARRRGEREGGEEEKPPCGDALAPFCDAVALIRTVRQGHGPGPGTDRAAVAEALEVRRRLRQLFALPGGDGEAPDAPLDRRRLALAVLAADPAAAHLVRRRGRRLAWSNGGTEVELARESRAGGAEHLEALLALETRALGLGGRETRVLITAALPVPVRWLVEAGLGRDRLGEPRIEGRGGPAARVLATLERVYARRVLESREEVPRGSLARDALADLFLAGRIFPETLVATRDRLTAAALAARLAVAGRPGWSEEIEALHPAGVPTLEEWVGGRLEELGFESGADLPLLTPGDLLAPELPPSVARELDRDYPRTLTVAGSEYRLGYDLPSRTATLEQVSGKKAVLPSIALLPRVPGFRLVFRFREQLRTLRD